MVRSSAFGLHVSVTCHTADGAWVGKGRERERQRGVWRVLNCICLTFWHVQHRLKITFAAEKCRTIRWRRQSVEWIATGDWKRKEEGGVGRDYMVTQRSTDKIDNWQMQSEHLGAVICVTPFPLSLFRYLAVNCISSKHFCGCFWQNKETLEKWLAISLDKLSICRLFSRLRRSSTWFASESTSIKSRFKFKCVDWLCRSLSRVVAAL